MGEVRIPEDGLVELRRAIEATTDDAIGCLREAGRRLGSAAESDIIARAGAPLPALSLNRFWSAVAGYFEEAGWGRIEHEPVNQGVGVVNASDWAESDADESRTGPGCHLTTGLLAELLTRAAGQPVAVMEVACRSHGDPACRFLFGSPTTLLHVHRRLAEDSSLEEALAAI